MLHNPPIFHKLSTIPKPFAKLRRQLLNITALTAVLRHITPLDGILEHFQAVFVFKLLDLSSARSWENKGRSRRASALLREEERHLLSTDPITLLQVKGSHYTSFQGHSTSKTQIYLLDYKEKIKTDVFGRTNVDVERSSVYREWRWLSQDCTNRRQQYWFFGRQSVVTVHIGNGVYWYSDSEDWNGIQ
jgi:hypothetical protein